MNSTEISKARLHFLEQKEILGKLILFPFIVFFILGSMGKMWLHASIASALAAMIAAAYYFHIKHEFKIYKKDMIKRIRKGRESRERNKLMKIRERQLRNTIDSIRASGERIPNAVPQQQRGLHRTLDATFDSIRTSGAAFQHHIENSYRLAFNPVLELSLPSAENPRRDVFYTPNSATPTTVRITSTPRRSLVDYEQLLMRDDWAYRNFYQRDKAEKPKWFMLIDDQVIYTKEKSVMAAPCEEAMKDLPKPSVNLHPYSNPSFGGMT